MQIGSTLATAPAAATSLWDRAARGAPVEAIAADRALLLDVAVRLALDVTLGLLLARSAALAGGVGIALGARLVWAVAWGLGAVAPAAVDLYVEALSHHPVGFKLNPQLTRVYGRLALGLLLGEDALELRVVLGDLLAQLGDDRLLVDGLLLVALVAVVQVLEPLRLRGDLSCKP